MGHYNYFIVTKMEDIEKYHRLIFESFDFEEFITSGGDVNTRDSDGFTFLMNACKYGDINAAKLLIMNKADVNLRDSKGHSALYFACCEQNDDITLLLLDNGARAEKDQLTRAYAMNNNMRS